MTDHGTFIWSSALFLTRRRNEASSRFWVRDSIQQNEDHRAPGEGDDNNHLLVLAQDERVPETWCGLPQRHRCMGSIASRA